MCCKVQKNLKEHERRKWRNPKNYIKTQRMIYLQLKTKKTRKRIRTLRIEQRNLNSFIKVQGGKFQNMNTLQQDQFHFHHETAIFINNCCWINLFITILRSKQRQLQLLHYTFRKIHIFWLPKAMRKSQRDLQQWWVMLSDKINNGKTGRRAQRL